MLKGINTQDLQILVLSSWRGGSGIYSWFLARLSVVIDAARGNFRSGVDSDAWVEFAEEVEVFAEKNFEVSK